ncbi:methyl-accepting chemotaxis protein [Ferrimonas aestuarii]|uniref:Methyl-accepting chemotaxis protein n=1 Tax=Ferrimonas aestuarii TaxID=2569539 RepID=A0A4U1BHZ6_9GAMM|nr:methyl-accepting chemotaxis protein [Ferrimonas aestuarii]TKB50923.1 methyl-accepting chemotaxis protein [Ferrimonas aestuarii]
MNITVSLRVLGGFTIVTLLLLVIGGLSLTSINTVETHTRVFQSFSVPAKDSLNTLTLNLSNQFINVQSAYTTASDNQLNQLEAELNDQGSAFQQQTNSLKQLLSSRDDFQINPQSLSEYQQFTASWQDLLSHKRDLNRNRDSLKESLTAIEDAGDDAGSILLDIMDLELSENRTEQMMAGEANNMDTEVANAVAIAMELSGVSSIKELNVIQQESDFLLRSIRFRLEDLSKKAVEVGQQDLIDELSSYLTPLLDQFEGSNGLIQKQQQAITLQQQIDQAFTTSKQSYGLIIEGNNTLQQQLATLNTETGNLAISSLDSTRTQTWAVMLASVLFATFISVVTRRSITQPLDHINEGLSILAQGDLTQRLTLNNRDEFGRVAKNINALSDSLRTLIASILERADQLAAAAEETSAVTAQTTSGIQEQSSQIEQVANATTELSSSANEVATNANDALGETQQANEETQQAKALSENNGLLIQTLAQEVERAAQVINKLNSDTAAIGGILDVIRGVAEQTNLLALNAAIEAARAGEQGRGFAVVADEVRSLASRTQQSTTEIQQMIEMVQASAKEAEQVMQNSQEQAQRSVTTTEEANQALEAITQSVAQVVSAANQISQAASEQNRVSQTISENLEQIATISEQTSSGAVQTASSSQQVAQLAEELQHQVREFKV